MRKKIHPSLSPVKFILLDEKGDEHQLIVPSSYSGKKDQEGRTTYRCDISILNHPLWGEGVRRVVHSSHRATRTFEERYGRRSK